MMMTAYRRNISLVWLIIAVGFNSALLAVVPKAQAFSIQSTHTWSGIQSQVYNRNQRQQQQKYRSFNTPSWTTSHAKATTTTTSRNSISGNTLTMRDASASYWFRVGDRVKVVDDVTKAGINLRNRQGKVVETWEKCDVDPTCCCAEQVDIGMAVRVEFQGTESDETVKSESFLHYFAEAELEKVVAEPNEEPSAAAFDGMSCVAFKLDQLKMGKQAQRIAAFEASQSSGENNEADQV